MNKAYPRNFWRKYKKNLLKTILVIIIIDIQKLDFCGFLVHP
jgi:hypothetical protein